ncbi:DUF1492 domain-containing protein [Streptococcus suis]|uniref:DUF1492 domain-containing protein n=1 Tax=Streptococcus suis TaxID=1307 RepID=UPI0005CE6DEB|nr:DUF1492 domain-containing protein [Streptococcus suis]MDW8760265.1 DUF1492 domain-containing protein [Streptococcus suis]NQP66581.1 DUF1492 domain-containing protein [Streptococcus suis]NQR00304.1 DUF1492 domain-containing protein [Streptococcus suis]NQR91355.1 DUF1492 domain-containing protein [Streptococcus suis]CYX69524.1 phage protein [Streptococcus suis]
MNVDEVRIKLEGIKWLDEEMRGLQLELQYLEQGLFKKSSLTQTKVQTSRVNNAENEVVYAIKLKQDIEERLAEIISERLESSRLIDKASNPLERAVLRMAYVNRLEIWDIEKRVNRSKTTIYNIKKAGIESIARAMSDD